MASDAERYESAPREPVTTATIKCDTCRRELKSAKECLSAGGGCICEACYRSLLSPHMKINFGD